MVIITGASGGIGNYLLKYFMTIRKDVVGLYNNTKPDPIQGERYIKVDISNHEDIIDFISSVGNELSDLILINCAGINYNSFAHKADMKKWSDVIKVNLNGTFNIIHALLPYMRKNNYGRIINLSSVVPQIGVQGTSAYSASKAGLWGLTKSISIENSSLGITINDINLGYFDIGIIKEVPMANQDELIKKIPIHKLGDPADIVRTVQYIIDTEYLNGTSINLNGGLY
ncbi:MAG: SDR family NAD(P)-dependent oxidoreductase [Candidatus Delongbacteria bacterium]|jgi:acetoacetyl-CoA reductase/3-oxoacyl-[acyl-carrier protein] reductase|nr:SDR family NAD(P)-dependent oxidoreductase [Candidatus Delongbacteria bacterium]